MSTIHARLNLASALVIMAGGMLHATPALSADAESKCLPDQDAYAEGKRKEICGDREGTVSYRCNGATVIIDAIACKED